ncbi:hypothetical protein NG796_01735 [Laspinema sp. A4]|uniref:hypothetical protein n=1 Tax=Laspinema sp. D2d TaxID=2953686 RepID=UPI0021BAC64C|nr:hypothetical protein [Laspinema sp. D2d]MCT7982009.1 hypothetical protein [Laspinema sp. D2d]
MQALASLQTFPQSLVKPSFSYAEKKAKIYYSDILPKSEVSELFFSVWQRHEMTEINRQQLKLALLSYSELNDSDYRLINRLLHAVKRGWIKMID